MQTLKTHDMNCDILKIVRGNDFATQMTITALDAGGNVIEDFSLEDSTDVVVKYTLAGQSHNIEAYDYEIEGNDITIQWSDLALGKYGFEIEGKFNGYSWRSAARFIFQIVADNASANIPDGVLVADGVYKLSDWLRLLSGTGGGGKQVQANWSETDTKSPAYIQNKPNLEDKQDTLVSGENIKTINGESILGEGNIEIGGAVDSVNGQTGVVVLDATDVGAASAEEFQGMADDVATLQAAYAGLTQSDIVVGALPASGIANTIYRVPSTSSYSDYMWNGSDFVLMATYTIPAGYGDIQKLISKRWGYVVFDESGIIKKRIKLTSGVYSWADDYYCQLIPTTSGMKYKIIANSQYSTSYCFLTSNDTTTGATPNWASGYSSFLELDVNASAEVVAPSDAQYLYIYVGNASMHRAPSIEIIDTNLEEKINVIAENTYVEVLKRGDYAYGIGSNGKFGADDSFYHDAIKVKAGDAFILFNIGDTDSVRYCFATDTTSGRNTSIPLVSGTTVHSLLRHTHEYIVCPTDCYLLWNSVGYNSLLKQSAVLEFEKIENLVQKKILVIGDSWGRDIATELWSVARDMNLNLFVAQAYQGGSTLYNQYKGMDDATRHYTHGSFEQYTQGTYQLWEYNSATPIKTPDTGYNNGKCGVNDGTAWGKDGNGNWAAKTLAEILASQDWDIILIRLHCGDLQNIDSLTTTDDAKGFFDINDFIARMEQELTPECLAKVKWGLASTWSYPEEAALTFTPVQSVLNALDIADWSNLSNTEKQEVYAELYPNIEANFPLVCNHIGDKLSYAIDIAKAIQFGRKSNWLKDVAWHMNRSSTDMHLGNGIPKYLCALSLLYSIFNRTKNDLLMKYLPDLSDGGGDGGSESNPTTPTKALCVGSCIVAWAAMCDVTTFE